VAVNVFVLKEFIVMMHKVWEQNRIDWKNGQALVRTQRNMARREGMA